MTLSWLPAGTVTGIGSLPGEDESRAWAASLSWCPELPFEPTLLASALSTGGARIGGMLIELFPESGELFDESSERGIAIRRDAETRFVEILGRHTPEFVHRYPPEFLAHRAVKSQMIGPLTLATCLRFQNAPLLEQTLLLDLLSTYLQRVARSIVTALSSRGAAPLVFVDEPVFAQGRGEIGVEQLDAVLTAISASGGVPGLHSCAGTIPEAWDRRPAAVVSFDVTTPLRFSQVLNTPEAVRFTRRGGVFALGAVSPVHSLSSNELLDGLARLESPVRASILSHSLITPSCGLGLTTWSAAEEAFASASSLSRALASAEHL